MVRNKLGEVSHIDGLIQRQAQSTRNNIFSLNISLTNADGRKFKKHYTQIIAFRSYLSIFKYDEGFTLAEKLQCVFSVRS